MQPSSMIKVFLALVASASPALAELAMTAPVAGTICTAGQPCTITWNDNRQGVSLAQQGNCTVALYTGNAQQQTFLQPIAYPQSINVSTIQSIQFTPDATVGQNSDLYFIRFSSQTLANPASPTNPYLSFSAKFTLAGMTGTFNSSVQAQLAGITSASAAPSSTSGAASSTATTTRATSTTSRTNGTNNAGSRGAVVGVSSGSAGVLVAGAALVAGVVSLF